MRVNSPGSCCGATAGGEAGASVPLPNVRVNSLTGLKLGRPEDCCTAGLCGMGPAGEGVWKKRVNSPGPDFVAAGAADGAGVGAGAADTGAAPYPAGAWNMRVNSPASFAAGGAGGAEGAGAGGTACACGAVDGGRDGGAAAEGVATGLTTGLTTGDWNIRVNSPGSGLAC